jgi:hypothetical protein
VWKVQLRAGSGENEKWFQIQDLIVEEIRKEMIFLGETVIQVPISPHGHPTVADRSLSLSRSGNASSPQWKAERDGSVQTMYFIYASKLTLHLACLLWSGVHFSARELQAHWLRKFFFLR